MEHPTMSSISAANNVIIDLNAGAWQMLQGGEPGLVLATAAQDGLRYDRKFANMRRLPASGYLPTDSIEQVVLGWQKSDESWHLGLILRPVVADERGSRWCELARWPDPDHSVFGELAQEAGERAAILLDIPFQYIQPEPLPPALPPRALPSLPLALGPWQLVESGTHHGTTLSAGQLALVRTSQWRQSMRMRVLLNLLWAVLYAAVSILTLTAAIDLPNAGTLIPNPHLLPYLGLIIALGFLCNAVYRAIRLNTEVRLITVDTVAITAHNLAGPLWAVQAADARSIYVSEVLKRQKIVTTEYGEINIHLGGGQFQRVLMQDVSLSHEDITPPDDWQRPAKDKVQPLERANYFTDLQAVVLLVSEKLGIAAWMDIRSSSWVDQLLRLR